jgi:Cu/Ag efflux pump CusA
VWGVPEIRESLTDVRELLIDTPSGRQVRLEQLADVRINSTPTSISRQGISRLIDVVAEVDGRDVGAVLADVRERLRAMPFPLEYHPELIGDHEQRQVDLQRVLGFVAAAAIGVLLLLQAAFGSWRLAAMTFLALPLALSGGVVAMALTGAQLSVGSLVGLLTVFAIAVRAAIFQVARYQELERERMPLDVALVIRGTRERFSATLTTAVATALAFAPFLVLGDRAGLEILRPAAVVVVGGLVTSTLLALFVVPALYLRVSGVQPAALEVNVPGAAESQVAGVN